ncbi:alpha/beta hydrolase [Nonomuraea africana]|uniref:Pimeloyl-ACP methyl ester carboxylesterase n=1 Tax=Nonomuraea africana TaxID=46171 RepID=A0ABR9KJB3_9ACTN|nr:alpha/beta fold hydrolase [Nonomuraea africana]MBE1562111.1 pimeloyl-ACP methyl ester carboxylesterase [Nonomuraea africana]
MAALNAAGYRTIAPDLRGFGASAKPEELAGYDMAEHVGDLLGVLDHFEVPEAHLVGHDWGAALAQMVAINGPARATSLSLLSVGHIGAGGPAAGIEQLEKSWYMLLFQLEDIAERWFSHDDFANMRAWLATHPEREEVIARMRDPQALTARLGIYRRNLPPQVRAAGGLRPLDAARRAGKGQRTAARFLLHTAST